MIRAVLFDIDGTLVHTGGAGSKAFELAFASEFSVRNGSANLRFAGRTDSSLVRQFFVEYEIDPSAGNFQRFYTAYLRHLESQLIELQGYVQPGIDAFLADLRALPEPPVVGLLTGNIRRGAELKLRRYEIWDRFHPEIGAFGDDHEERDQIAAIARERTAQSLGRPVAGEEILVIGDTPLDIQCARAIGAQVLAVATGGAPLDQLESHRPDWAVKDLKEITVKEIWD